MAMPRKTYTKEDGKTYKVCTRCGEEKEAEANFYHWLRKEKYLAFDSQCHDCKQKYNHRYRMDQKKKDRKAAVVMEEAIKSLRAYAESWREIEFFAKKIPLAQGFQSPQEFILATLKTTYDNGRQKTG
jgi:hypothetical protein